MNIENLKKVRDAIAEEERPRFSGSIMASFSFWPDLCESPSCIAGHCFVLADYKLGRNSQKVNTVLKIAQEYLDLSNYQASELFMPYFEYANFCNYDKSDYRFITKKHVLRCLDLLISEEDIDIDDAWKISKEIKKTTN